MYAPEGFAGWGAIRTLVSGARSGQFIQCADHILQMRDLMLQVFDTRLHQGLDVGTAPVGVAPQVKQRGNLADRKTQIPRLRNEPKHVNIGIAVIPIPRGLAGSLRDQADLFIITDHLGRYTRTGRCVSDVHGETPFFIRNKHGASHHGKVKGEGRFFGKRR